MSASTAQHPYFDPYDAELNTDPYPMFRRLRPVGSRLRLWPHHPTPGPRGCKRLTALGPTLLLGPNVVLP
jgi:hypothetical protein